MNGKGRFYLSQPEHRGWNDEPSPGVLQPRPGLAGDAPLPWLKALPQPPARHPRWTGADRRDSGNSRCSREYGGSLSAEEKRALLEYLKVL
ncbi:hypothetical protein AO896_30390 [Pseudomonas aeruginosa]|uniref:Cytochrome c n=1 Tax=Pseudomonas aeruginosa TaxID=287 RepID=A0ABD7KA58_PSEAI|nr:hypothetical protein AO898_30700 [Pseudomonas aeruginosa]OPD70304.1 hypothetical protein AO896_30390 [Pseudomonas aeruginosa]OPD86268.1 hypothetical protein AO955_32300 [Pseudomonas aeruginosa]RTS02523.1 hypothetical protein DY932_01135 [Pseudomonas paraeruginosa]RTS52448.1 hypothetical protein DY940_01135 [Pseudomonas aeruginosa]